MISFNILNLKNRSDRRHVIIGNLDTQQIPYEDVAFHDAPYGRIYPTSQAMCDAAIADGYPEFERLTNIGRGTIGAIWGTHKIFDLIAQGEYPYGYYNQDDKLLLLTYSQILGILDRLRTLPDKFLMLQLTYAVAPNAEIRDAEPVAPDSMIVHGIQGSGDSGIILSPMGAALVMEQWRKYPETHEMTIGRMRKLPGTYSMIDPNYAIRSINTRYFGHNDWHNDQDRILIDGE